MATWYIVDIMESFGKANVVRDNAWGNIPDWQHW